jgi:FkbM family methyltransferase
MQRGERKLAFVLASTDHGTMIVNRLDYRVLDANRGIGVGLNLLERGHFDPEEVKLALNLLMTRRRLYGDGVVAIDCGANIGVHSIEWAKSMTGWGSVLSIEAQERIYYALAGNIAINNCFNAVAINAAVSSESGTLTIPTPNYLVPGSFGSLELRQRSSNEFIGQAIDYTQNTATVPKLALDQLNLPRVDFIKIDIEGMELEALEGAKETIDRTHPIMLIEKIKTDVADLKQWLATRGYQMLDVEINMLAIHASDRTLAEIAPKAQPSAA